MTDAPPCGNSASRPAFFRETSTVISDSPAKGDDSRVRTARVQARG